MANGDGSKTMYLKKSVPPAEAENHTMPSKRSFNLRHTAMMSPLSILLASACLRATSTSAFEETSIDSSASFNDQHDYHRQRVHQAKLDLWLRGAFAMSPTTGTADDGNSAAIAADFEMQVAKAPLRHGPVRDVRRRLKHDLGLEENAS